MFLRHLYIMLTFFIFLTGDSMENHNNMMFSTKDQDNTLKGVNCGGDYSSGWWFNECYKANLNGKYNNKTHGIHWNTWKHSVPLPKAEIKIKPFKV